MLFGCRLFSWTVPFVHLRSNEMIAHINVLKSLMFGWVVCKINCALVDFIDYWQLIIREPNTFHKMTELHNLLNCGS